jgi:hypothetical protein
VIGQHYSQISGGRLGAERHNRVEQPMAVGPEHHPEILQVFGRELGQRLTIDFIIAKGRLVAFEPELPQPIRNVYRRHALTIPATASFSQYRERERVTVGIPPRCRDGRQAMKSAQTPLYANLHVGSGVYLVYSEHISAIPIEKADTQNLRHSRHVHDGSPDGLNRQTALELRKLSYWTNPSRGGTCRRTKE